MDYSKTFINSEDMKVTQVLWIFSYYLPPLLANKLATDNLGSKIKAIKYVKDVHSASAPILPFATLQEDPNESLP